MREETLPNTQSFDPLSLLIQESEAYKSLEDIEKIVDKGMNLHFLPLQPLYFALKTSSTDQVADYLPRLSSEQRKVLIDLDLWTKDSLDIEKFHFWLKAYSHCPHKQTKFSFAKSEQFLLYLKSKFNIWTFDVEDPQYPDHDHYFLTEDQLLLFEFDEKFPHAQEIQHLLGLLYSEWGVEEAYTFLFKLVSDSQSMLEEEEYEQSVARLREFGLVDYFSALEMHSTYPSLKLLNHFLKSKIPATGNIDERGRIQGLHSSCLIPFRQGSESLKEELQKISSTKRKDFLQFNFVRLINGTLSFNGALKSSQVAISRVGQETKSWLLLGLDYLKHHQIEQEAKQGQGLLEGILASYEFTDLFKIGRSLIQIQQSRIKKALAQNGFEAEEAEAFLGEYWNKFLENTFSSPAKNIDSWPLYIEWRQEGDLLINFLPFVKKFYTTLKFLKDEGRIRDEFYLNYDVTSIDLEAILISSFMNFSLGKFEDPNIQKMGVTLIEFKDFVAQYCVELPQTALHPKTQSGLWDKILEFKRQFGLEGLQGLEDYFYQILDSQLSGYELQKLGRDDFQHVGGPILLA